VTKFNPAQTQAAQARADRRQEALDRRGDTAIQADNQRIRNMYNVTQPVNTKMQDTTIYLLGELDRIQDEQARNRAYQLAALWSIAVPGVEFPGVLFGQDTHTADQKGNWYVNGLNLPGDLPAMICSNGRLTREFGQADYIKVGNRGYKYATVTVRTALARAKSGKDLFNYGV
jgi:hypothetical protein